MARWNLGRGCRSRPWQLCPSAHPLAATTSDTTAELLNHTCTEPKTSHNDLATFTFLSGRVDELVSIHLVLECVVYRSGVDPRSDPSSKVPSWHMRIKKEASVILPVSAVLLRPRPALHAPATRLCMLGIRNHVPSMPGLMRMSVCVRTCMHSQCLQETDINITKHTCTH